MKLFLRIKILFFFSVISAQTFLFAETSTTNAKHCNNQVVRIFFESGIANLQSGNFHEAISDFGYVLNNSSNSDVLLFANLLRDKSYICLENLQSCTNSLEIENQTSSFIIRKNRRDFENQPNVFAKGKKPTVLNIDLEKCQRKCDVARVAADAICAGILTRGNIVVGTVALATCVAFVEVLTQQCHDCCHDGFENCTKEIDAITSDFVNALFPTDPSIFD